MPAWAAAKTEATRLVIKGTLEQGSLALGYAEKGASVTVDGEKVNASGSHGVLTVTIPKQAKAMPRRIQIGT